MVDTDTNVTKDFDLRVASLNAKGLNKSNKRAKIKKKDQKQKSKKINNNEEKKKKEKK